MQMTWEAALAARRQGIKAAKFPAKGESRVKFPLFTPRFELHPDMKVFTIGSCFARHIERKLKGFNLPTLQFSAPYAEAPHSSNTLLNEYNPGTMSQRISFALSGTVLPEETIVETKDGYIDLSLPGGFPVAFNRAVERRKEIAAIYEELNQSDVVVITLGFVEAWFDEVTGLYLNQMPPPNVLKASGSRFVFRRLDVEEVLPLLDSAVNMLVEANLKVLLTVSPVPLGSTFSGVDAVLANEYSKSVLRVCAQTIYDRYDTVDYFPSYEIVRLCGEPAYEQDNVHVRVDLVGEVTDYMVSCYLPSQPAVNSSVVV